MKSFCKLSAHNCVRLNALKVQKNMGWNSICGTESEILVLLFLEIFRTWVKKVVVVKMGKTFQIMELTCKTKMHLREMQLLWTEHLSSEILVSWDWNHLIIWRNFVICSETVSTNKTRRNTCKLWKQTSIMITPKYTEALSKQRSLTILTVADTWHLKSLNF